MNWMANLWTNLWTAPRPEPIKPVMIMSAPAPTTPIEFPPLSPDVVQLARSPRRHLDLTQGAPVRPTLIANNSAGLAPKFHLAGPRRQEELTNSMPMRSGIAAKNMGSLAPLLELLASWARPRWR